MKQIWGRIILIASVLWIVPSAWADDTVLLQGLRNQARNTCAPVILEARIYLISRPLDGTDSGCTLVIRGQGMLNTRLVPTAAMAVILDLSGSRAALHDFSIGDWTQPSVPPVAGMGVLLAATTTGASDMVLFDHVYITGRYSTAALYNYGVSSSSCLKSAFYNYHPDWGAAMKFSANNTSGVLSPFKTLLGGWLSTSDWSFVGCEIHRFTQSPYVPTLDLDAVGAITFFGGNISGIWPGGGNSAYVVFEGAGPSKAITFVGTSFYTDAPNHPASVFRADTSVELLLLGINWPPDLTLFAGGPYTRGTILP